MDALWQAVLPLSLAAFYQDTMTGKAGQQQEQVQEMQGHRKAKYTERAALLFRAFFVDEETRMLPNMRASDCEPGRRGPPGVTDHNHMTSSVFLL